MSFEVMVYCGLCNRILISGLLVQNMTCLTTKNVMIMEKKKRKIKDCRMQQLSNQNKVFQTDRI